MSKITVVEQATPSVPSAGQRALYAKSDGKMYTLDASGAEREVVLQTPSVPSFTGKNAIINGDMEIAQRGTSFATIADGTYSLDRWLYNKVGAAVHTVTQDTDVPTVAQAGRLFTHSLKLALTTADTSIAAGDYCIVGQKIEGYNWRALAQRVVTLSFWIKSPITGIHCAALRNSGTPDRSCVKEFTILATNTWEKKTLTFPASPSAGTWDYTNGVGAWLTIALAAGSTFQGTADSYQSSNIFATSNQVNGVNTGITPYFITGVQLEPGNIATEFENRMVLTELLHCYRYYVKMVHPASNLFTQNLYRAIRGMCWSATAGSLSHPLPVQMRATPTGTFTVGNCAVQGSSGGDVAVTSFQNPFLGTHSIGTEFSVAAGLTAGHATSLYLGTTGSWEANAEL